MSELLPEILNPLSHSGTSQYERMAEELHFDYVQIEERHEVDFLQYAAKLAEALTFYDDNNVPTGNWQAFFDDHTSRNVPHKALFIAFVKLLEALNEHANGLLPQHLDYYYRDILQFTRQHAAARNVHLFFKCAKTLEERLLEKGTLFAGGKDADGKEILFETVDELVINQTVLSACLTTFKHTETFGERVFTKDFTTQLLDDQINEGLPVLGESQLVYEKIGGDFKKVFRKAGNFTMDTAKVGWSVSSSMFKLPEGRRTVTISWHFTRSIPDFDPSLFQFFMTTEDGWHQLRNDQLWIAKSNNAKKLTMTFTLLNTDPAFTAYDPLVHGGQYPSANPAFRVLLKHDEVTTYAYTKWKKAQLEDITLKVSAEGVRSLIFQNDVALLEASKPFNPFGPLPAIGNHFYVGHPDIFNEPLATAQLNIRWKEVPQANFSGHYQLYSNSINNNSFKVKTAMLDRKEWHHFNGTANLFHAQNAQNESVIGFNLSDLPSIDRKGASQLLEKWDYLTSHGFLRLTLSSPDDVQFKAFGHDLYNHVARTNANTSNQIKQPYTPVIEQATLSYETKEVSLVDNAYDTFYHELPFGHRKVAVEGAGNPVRILPALPAEGTFCIGLQKLNTPQSVSILFQLRSGSGDATESRTVTNVNWFYLRGDEWMPLDRLRISKDTTGNLLHSGIIRFDLPEDMDDQHMAMPTGHYWLKAEMPQYTAGIDWLQSIHLHAATLTEASPGSSPALIGPGEIKKPQSNTKGIAVTQQPYASFDGRSAENEEEYYVRIHERLRHKDRGVAIWDYERLVLQQFPDLYKVKCLNHTNDVTEVAAGHVMVAVIPDLKNKSVKSPFQPKISSYQRLKIYEFLRERISPFIYLRVVNPVYEPLRLSFNVGFHPGYDEGFYGRKLHQQIQEFLSPWAFESHESYGRGLAFGGELHKSTLLKFVEDLPYVDFVNDFTMYHQYCDPSIAASYADEIADQVANYTSVSTSGAVETFKIAFGVEDLTRPTALMTIELRFLKGLLKITDQELQAKFLKQLLAALNSKARNGKPITKTLIKSILKTFYYVDKLFAVSFHYDLPDGVVLEEVDVAKAKTSRSVMVTSEQHRIGVYKAGDYQCEGNVMIGIGVMIVEADFIVSPVKTQNNEYQTR